MSDISDRDGQEEESFAELLESYTRDRQEDLKVGDKISAEIISIGRDAVFVDTGSKIDGIVPKAELLDDGEELPYAIGDSLDLYVVAAGESRIELSPGLAGIGGLMHLEEAWKDNTPIDGVVEDRCKGGFNVNVLGKRAFCPISQIDLRYVEDPNEYIGNTYQFEIKTFEDQGRNIVVSRRDILQAEAEKASEAFYEDAVVGTVFHGKVTRVESYGAFVELLPTIEGMVHVSELSWSRTVKPADILKVGDPVTVRLLEVQRVETSRRLKISLTVRQMSEDPWNSVEEQLKSGDKVTGRVVRCADFGAFVELKPGIDGLIHISEMSYTKRVLKPDDVVSEGEAVAVVVKDIDVGRRRISLSLRDAAGDPWLDVPEKYPIGQPVDGTIENKESFGFFVRLEPGVTGLLPKSKIADSYDAAAIEKLKAGDTVSVVPEEMDPVERKMTLAPGDTSDMKDWKRFGPEQTSSLGALGEKLQEALARKLKE